MSQTTRREVLGSFAAGAAWLSLPEPAHAAPASASASSFRLCLNTSTIREQKLGIVREAEIAAAAGYSGIEPWMRDLDKYVEEGGSLSDLKKRIQDLGLTVESAIGFAQWIVDDDEVRAKGLEQARQDMDRLKQIGGLRIAAPPIGAHQTPGPDLLTAAARYRQLLEIGDSIGVLPQAEVWGFSKTLSRLGETAFVAIESQHPSACILPDVYHLYKGGSDFHGLKLLSGVGMHVFHINDYPAEPARAEITDAHRVYPGDGIAPLTAILNTLKEVGFHGALSLELFNPNYWKQDPLEVARAGREKIEAAIAAAK